jgi:hypothetical protein
MIRSIFKRQIDQKFKIPQCILNRSRKERMTRNILNRIMNLINQDVELIFNQFIIEICVLHVRVLSREILNTTLQIPNNLFTFTSTNYLYTYLYHIIMKYGFPEMIFSSYISIIEENQDFNFNVNVSNSNSNSNDFYLDLYVDVHPILIPEGKQNCFLLKSFDENNNDLFSYLDKFICDE